METHLLPNGKVPIDLMARTALRSVNPGNLGANLSIMVNFLSCISNKCLIVVSRSSPGRNLCHSGPS